MLQRFFGLSSIPKLWDSQHRQLLFFGRRLFFITSRVLDYTSLYLIKRQYTMLYMREAPHAGATMKESHSCMLNLHLRTIATERLGHVAKRVFNKRGADKRHRLAFVRAAIRRHFQFESDSNVYAVRLSKNVCEDALFSVPVGKKVRLIAVSHACVIRLCRWLLLCTSTQQRSRISFFSSGAYQKSG